MYPAENIYLLSNSIVCFSAKHKGVPPGGGSCWWCSRKLYKSRGYWLYAIIREGGYNRAVHKDGCYGEDSGLRPRVKLDIVGHIDSAEEAQIVEETQIVK